MKKVYITQKNVNKDDIRQVVSIHREEISQGFLSSLGDKPLSLLFYLAVESKYGILLLGKPIDRDKPIGFILGTTDTGAFYKDFLIKNFFRATIHLAPKVFSVQRLRKLFETLFYPSKKEIQDFPRAELFDIAILKEQQGKGLAQLLFKEFSATMKSKGIEKFKITTGENLIQAQRFYEKLGANKVTEIEVHKGQKTFVYLFDSYRGTNNKKERMDILT